MNTPTAVITAAIEKIKIDGLKEKARAKTG